MIDAIKNFLLEHPWILIALIAHGIVLGTVAYLILLERKTASWVQDRIGPNRVGPFGLLQPLADGLKFIVKEDYQPSGVDKVLFSLAPVIMITVIIISIAVLPFGGEHKVVRQVDITSAIADVKKADKNADLNAAAIAAAESHIPSIATQLDEPTVKTEGSPESEGGVRRTATISYQYPFQIAKLNIGVLFILGVLSLAVYGVVLGGWASNNKFSFLGGLRATAQMISYEIPLGLCVLCIVIMFGTLDLGEIVEKQAHYWINFHARWGNFGLIPAWNVFAQPFTFLMFLICIHAEANRAPFDLAECEQELVGGYHTEYSSMRFALFFLAEYAGMITTSAVCVALFFGGWHLPWVDLIWPNHFGDVGTGHPGVTTSLLICIVRALVYFTKTIGIIFIFMWVRWSLPRYRFDQLMMLAWRALIPISLGLLMATALVVYLFGADENRRFMRVESPMAFALFVINVVVIGLSAWISTMIPAAPATNRRVRVLGSRFNSTAATV